MYCVCCVGVTAGHASAAAGAALPCCVSAAYWLLRWGVARRAVTVKEPRSIMASNESKARDHTPRRSRRGDTVRVAAQDYFSESVTRRYRSVPTPNAIPRRPNGQRRHAAWSLAPRPPTARTIARRPTGTLRFRKRGVARTTTSRPLPSAHKRCSRSTG